MIIHHQKGGILRDKRGMLKTRQHIIKTQDFGRGDIICGGVLIWCGPAQLGVVGVINTMAVLKSGQVVQNGICCEESCHGFDCAWARVGVKVALRGDGEREHIHNARRGDGGEWESRDIFEEGGQVGLFVPHH